MASPKAVSCHKRAPWQMELVFPGAEAKQFLVFTEDGMKDDMRSVQNTGYLLYIWDDTTQFYSYHNTPI